MLLGVLLVLAARGVAEECRCDEAIAAAGAEDAKSLSRARMEIEGLEQAVSSCQAESIGCGAAREAAVAEIETLKEQLIQAEAALRQVEASMAATLAAAEAARSEHSSSLYCVNASEVAEEARTYAVRAGEEASRRTRDLAAQAAAGSRKVAAWTSEVASKGVSIATETAVAAEAAFAPAFLAAKSRAAEGATAALAAARSGVRRTLVDANFSSIERLDELEATGAAAFSRAAAATAAWTQRLENWATTARDRLTSAATAATPKLTAFFDGVAGVSVLATDAARDRAAELWKEIARTAPARVTQAQATGRRLLVETRDALAKVVGDERVANALVSGFVAFAAVVLFFSLLAVLKLLVKTSLRIFNKITRNVFKLSSKVAGTSAKFALLTAPGFFLFDLAPRTTKLLAKLLLFLVCLPLWLILLPILLPLKLAKMTYKAISRRLAKRAPPADASKKSHHKKHHHHKKKNN